VIASRGGKKIVIIGGDRDGRKPAAASKASDKKLAAEKKPNLRIAVAEKAPAKAGKAKPAQKTAAREAGTKAEKATKTPAKAANAKPAPGKRVKVAEAR
jgi:hypothetical protein